MNRDLFFFERFLRAGGYRPWNVLMIVGLSGSIDEDGLRAALAGLQAHHPMLTMQVVDTSRRPRFERLVPPQPIGLRIVARLGVDDWFAETCAELERPFGSGGSGQLLRLVWLRSALMSELILVADHCISDGRSLLLLMRELVGRLDPARPPRAALRRIRTIDDMFEGGLPTATATTPASWLSVMAPPARLVSGLGRLLRPPAPVSPSYVVRWEMAGPLGVALRDRCRAEAGTVYTALAASFSRAMRTLRPVQSRNRILCPVDVRSLMPGLEEGALSAFPDTMCMSLDTRLDHAFWPQVRALRRDMQAGRARLRPRRTLMVGEGLHALSDWFIRLQLHGRARNDLMFSHLGAATFADDADNSRVYRALGFLSSMPWRRTPAIFSLEDRACLRFFLVAREESLPREEAERIRDHAMTVIAQAVAA